MPTIKLTEDLTVRTFPKPPQDFDPLKADEKHSPASVSPAARPTQNSLRAGKL